ncbi:MAG: 50S ribosomal protein L10 [Candidatus Portnoybacteria bacterium]|nr:50S ribosomal protein L10 [Candidatus Portnoybacteria bacterium]
MLTRKQKEEIVKELAEKMERQESLVFTDISGISVEEMQDLRRKLREQGIEYKVAKKTLINLAFEKSKHDIDISGLKGSIGVAFGYEDPIMPAKILDKFSKEHEALDILGGVMEKRLLSMEEVKELAKIPSQEELLASLVGSLKAPMNNFVNILQGNIRNLVGVLNAIVNK